MITDIQWGALSALGACISAACACLSIYISRQTKKEENRPIVQVESIITKLSLSNEYEENSKRHYRIIHGEQTHDVTINNQVPVKKDLTDEELNFFDTHRGTLSLRVFRGDNSLIINSLPDSSTIKSMVLEVFTNCITFINQGAAIQCASINEAKIWIEGFDSPIVLKGTGQPLHLSVGKNERFQIYTLEITENFKNTICRMSDSVYKKLPREFDLLRLETGLYLTYKELHFSITFYTARAKIPYKYLYTLKNIDSRIYLDVTEIP